MAQIFRVQGKDRRVILVANECEMGHEVGLAHEPLVGNLPAIFAIIHAAAIVQFEVEGIKVRLKNFLVEQMPAEPPKIITVWVPNNLGDVASARIHWIVFVVLCHSLQ
jgi:hypothetical protein